MKIILIAFGFFFSTLLSATPLNKMVVFGDSLSDNGNLYEYMKHQLPVSPPYYKGRFTNGLVWVEHLIRYYYPTNSSEHLFDYAYGGAGVLDEDDGDDGLFTLRREIDSYFLANHNKADEKSMYVVWIGSNNYLAIPESNEVEKVLNDVNNGIKSSLQRLVDKGAKHILVVNVPSLGNTPVARDLDAIEVLAYVSDQHNSILQKNVQEFQSRYPDVQWLFFDVNVIFDGMMHYPERYGFTNVTDTCYEQAATSHLPLSVLKMVSTIKPKLKGPGACNGYLFFDPVHPSGPAHLLMAEKTKELFDKNGVEFE